MKVNRQDDLIVRCAERLTRKLKESSYRTLNGEFNPAVQVEIKRMKHHAKPTLEESNDG